MDNVTSNVPAERLTVDLIEMAYLSVIIVAGTVLNLMVFYQLVRTSKTPTASTSFLTGPYQINSFTLFKVNMTITDFAILLVHALGKVVWLTTYQWRFGNSGCKIYQFLSAFTYYSNSNIVVAIAVDRLKVVYTSHIQGAASVRRVRSMISAAWVVAAISALPQLYVWRTVEPFENWVQCSNVWDIAEHEGTLTPEFEKFKMIYEWFHQAIVFAVPFVILFGCYLFIVIRLLHHTLRPVRSYSDVRTGSASGGQHMCLRVTTAPSSDQYLLSSTDTLQAELCGVKKPIQKFQIPGSKHVKQLKCLLMGSSFSSRIMQKRRTVCLGSIRSCCRNADVGITSADKSLPVWRRQLRSRIFLTSLAIVIAHIALWLPYNLLNATRFIDEKKYIWILDNGGRFLEDLIVFNSVVNPILYMYETR